MKNMLLIALCSFALMLPLAAGLCEENASQAQPVWIPVVREGAERLEYDAVSALENQGYLSFGYAGNPELPDYQAAVTDATKKAQKKLGLSVTGEIDEALMNALSPGYTERRELEAQGYAVLEACGMYVQQLQADLQALGYYTYDLTGYFGTKTQEAVTAYQEHKGLTADGIVSPELLEAIHAESQ